MTAGLFLSVAALHLLAAISPGPAFVVAVRVAVREGFRPAIGLAFGLGLGAAVWAAAALAGLAAVLAVAPAALTALKLGGALFLIWLAIGMWRHASDPLPPVELDAIPRSIASALRFGILTQLANPKPAVFFGAVFAGLVPQGTPLFVIAALLVVIILNEALWYILVGRLFSSARARDAYSRLKSGIDRAFGGLLAALAAKLAIG